MKLTTEVKEYIDKSVLCWLATVNASGMPNVSPKEIFNSFGEEIIIIANIASPQSIRNIKVNNQVCVSFVDIWVQKGYKVTGTATIIDTSNDTFEEMENILLKMTGGKFPFLSIISISIQQVQPIIAPKYLLYPDTTEIQQIKSAKKAYGV